MSEDIKKVILDIQTEVFLKSSKLRKGTEWIEKELEISNESCYFSEPLIYVQEIDVLEKAIELGENVLVLCMADYGVDSPLSLDYLKNSQEYGIYSRTNLLYSLSSFTKFGNSIFGYSNGSNGYPLPVFGGIYSPSVCIYRDKDLNRTKKTYNCNVITSTMFNKTILSINGDISENYKEIIRRKIRTILRISITKGHYSLVLGAWGCGYLGLPAKSIAKIFKEILSEPEFKHSFREICFAILEEESNYRITNSEGNLNPFIDEFELIY